MIESEATLAMDRSVGADSTGLSIFAFVAASGAIHASLVGFVPEGAFEAAGGGTGHEAIGVGKFEGVGAHGAVGAFALAAPAVGVVTDTA